MSNWDKERLLRSSILAGFFAAGLVATPALAQESDEPVTTQEEEDEQEATTEDRIVVTGSRIRRDTFTSTAPLQIVDGETIAEAGLVDVGEILRSTTVVQGVQLDQQFNSSFVSNAGPGGQAVALRGLDPERTLVLTNGRRLAPAGVEGAPSFPDVSLIPSSMIERIDILLDGASSVYGSDAVAGVINVILVDDFEGFEVGAFRDFATGGGGGESTSVNFRMGGVGDRFDFIIAGEYTATRELRGDQRDWMFNGEIYGSIDILPGENDGDPDQFLPGDDGFQSFVAAPGFPFFVGRPGAGEFSDNFTRWPGGLDPLIANNTGMNQDRWLTPDFQSTTLYAKAEYDIGDLLPGTTAFVDFNLSNRQTYLLQARPSFDLSIPGDSQFIIDEFGSAALGDTTLRPVQPWRNTLDVELEQWRVFTGLQGDLGFVGLDRWDYETFAGYSRSVGSSMRTGVDEINLYRALGGSFNADGVFECADPPDLAGPFSSNPTYEACVPFNPLAPSLWQFANDGTLPTFTSPTGDNSAEYNQQVIDYLQGNRLTNTFVDERILGGFVTGPVFEVPAGEVQTVLGFEWRESSIESRFDDSSSSGLLRGFFSDAPTNGNVELFEVFGEAVIPLVSNQPLIHDLNVELAGRYVDHEFYGSNSVYSIKGNYAPVDWLNFRATYGTSFRAPNLRELFLAGQSGFAADPDPCRVPGIAQIDDDGDGTIDRVDPELDTRTDIILDNCRAEGIDPLTFSIGVFGGSVEVFSAGNTGLDPEESTAWSLGFTVEQPWFDAFDLRFGVNAFEVKIDDSVFEPSAAFLIGECYSSTNFPDDPFCTRRTRNPDTNFLVEVDATPFNVAEETSSGFDFNVSYSQDFTFRGRDFTGGLDLVSTFTEENSQLIILAGEEDFEDFAGDIGTPEWRSTANARIQTGNWTLFWQTQYIGEQQATNISDRPSNCYDVNGTAADTSDDIILSERCYSVPNYWVHNASISYQPDNWVVRVGLSNVFDEDPPQTDEDVTAALDARSVPIGVGYDRTGRSVFVNVSRSF